MIPLGPKPIGWWRIRKMAGRLMLCLAFLLPSLADAGAAHHETPAATAAGHSHDGHGNTPAAPDQDDVGQVCHHFGACQVFVAPTIPGLAHYRSSFPLMIAIATQPPKATTVRLFRPPRAGFTA